MAYERSSGCFSHQREKNHAQWTYFMCDMMYLISTKEVVAKRSAHDDLTKHIQAHLIAAKHEKFADDYDGRLKVTYATVSRYLNDNGRDLPKTKLRVTGSNVLELWQKHKPQLDL